MPAYQISLERLPTLRLHLADSVCSFCAVVSQSEYAATRLQTGSLRACLLDQSEPDTYMIVAGFAATLNGPLLTKRLRDHPSEVEPFLTALVTYYATGMTHEKIVRRRFPLFSIERKFLIVLHLARSLPELRRRDPCRGLHNFRTMSQCVHHQSPRRLYLAPKDARGTLHASPTSNPVSRRPETKVIGDRVTLLQHRRCVLGSTYHTAEVSRGSASVPTADLRPLAGLRRVGDRPLPGGDRRRRADGLCKGESHFSFVALFVRRPCISPSPLFRS